jgi:DNA primase
MAMLQFPNSVGKDLLARGTAVAFSNGALAAVRDAVAMRLNSFEQPDWVAIIQETVPDPVKTLVVQLAVAPVPERPERELDVYLQQVVLSLVERDLVRRKEELLGQFQRTDATAHPDEHRDLQRQLMQVEADRRALRE